MTCGSISEKSIGEMLKYQLSADPSYAAGKPVRIGFKLQNLSNENLWILSWYTPLEDIKSKIFRVICDGKEIPYEGRMVKRGDPEETDYIYIASKGSISAQVDLLKAYNLPACKECQVAFKGRIHDIVTDENRLPSKSEDHQWFEILGNMVSFRIVEG
jgi:hypothetical protein